MTIVEGLELTLAKGSTKLPRTDIERIAAIRIPRSSHLEVTIEMNYDRPRLFREAPLYFDRFDHDGLSRRVLRGHDGIGQLYVFRMDGMQYNPVPVTVYDAAKARMVYEQLSRDNTWLDLLWHTE